MSNFLVYRDFPDGVTLDYLVDKVISKGKRYLIKDINDLDSAIKESLKDVDFSKTGILLSGGVDSALLASYCPPGTLAFTISYPEINDFDEAKQAEIYANKFGLRLVKVPVVFQDVLDFQDDIMLFKQEPLHSIEIALHKCALRALDFGLENLLTGMGADVTFGGLTNIMSRTWTKEDFIKRYMFMDPSKALKEPQPDYSFFDKFLINGNFDANLFMQKPFGKATQKYFLSAVESVGVNLIAPFEHFDRGFSLSIDDMLNGHEKRMLRELLSERSGGLVAPKKRPLPRPLNVWKNYFGDLINPEFLPDAYNNCQTDEQRWLLYALDHWLYLQKNNCFKHYDVCYTTGVYDMFHMGHLNLLRRASKMCNKLIVGVTNDSLVSYKHKHSTICFEDRIRIVRSLPFVYKAVEQSDMNKKEACIRFGANAIVVGDDWKNTDKWNNYEKELSEVGIDVIYLPYTKRISTTKLVETIKSEK